MQSLQNPYTNLPYYSGISFVPYPGGTGSISYPPLSPFVFAICYRLYLTIGEPSRFVYYFLLKQPMILADVSIAVVLFKIVLQSQGLGSARTVFLTWMYFPIGILVSAVWGALDPIALVLTLLAAYCFLHQRTLASASLLGVGIFMKTIPIVTLPVFLMQNGFSWVDRIRYATTALVIPIVSTLVPILLLRWGFTGFVNNSAFQTEVPVYGAMSIMSILSFLPSIPATVRSATELLWIPSLIIALAYVKVRKLSLLQGLLVSILGLSLFRPFLPEQWCVYPLALLLSTFNRENLRHFVGLAVPSGAFLVVNNAFLVIFLSPVSLGFYQWSLTTNNPAGLVIYRALVLVFLAGVFFLEAFLSVMGRRSVVYRFLIQGPSSGLLTRLGPVSRKATENAE